jgi:hypothetical protein
MPRPIHHPELTKHTIWDVFEAERPQLVPYAGRFDGFHAVPASVSKTCLVRFARSPHSSLRHHRDRQRELALQEPSMILPAPKAPPIRT